MKKINVEKSSRNEGKRNEKIVSKMQAVYQLAKSTRVGILLKMETRSEKVLRLHGCQLMPTVKQRQQHEFCRRQLTQYLNNSSDTHFSLDFSNRII